MKQDNLSDKQQRLLAAMVLAGYEPTYEDMSKILGCGRETAKRVFLKWAWDPKRMNQMIIATRMTPETAMNIWLSDAFPDAVLPKELQKIDRGSE